MPNLFFVHIQPSCWASCGTTWRELQRRTTNIKLVSHSLSLSLSLFLSLPPSFPPSLYVLSFFTHAHKFVLFCINTFGFPCTLCRPTSTSESPTLMAKNLMRRHNQLNLPESPSQGSTPAELAEEEVTKLSDQVNIGLLHDYTLQTCIILQGLA